MIQRFECHAGAHCAIADHCNDTAIDTLSSCGDRHSKRGTDRGARVSDAKGVVFAFAACWERREPVFQFDRAEAIATARQKLVRIRLVADVPHEAIVWSIEDIMQ